MIPTSICTQEIMKKKIIKQRKLYCLMSAMLCALAIAYLSIGKTVFGLDTIFHVFQGNDTSGASFTILQLRLPRLLIGILGGMAFGIAGNTFQTMLRNPLASPDIIGVSAGTSVAAVFCLLILQISGAIVSIISVLCGIGIAGIIYLFSRGQRFSGSRMILIGLGLQAMMNAVISYILLRANQQDIASALRWLSGSLTGAQMNRVGVLGIIVISCVGILIYLEKPLRMMELGDDISITLGVNIGKARCLSLFCAVIMIAFTTSICGPISFISFLAGPIAKHIAGAGASRTILAGIVGASIVLIGDSIGQTLFSTRFPVGVMTGVLGAPYLLFLLIRMNKTGGF